MTKKEVYSIIEDLVDYVECKNGYIEQFYEVDSYDDDYDLQKASFL